MESKLCLKTLHYLKTRPREMTLKQVSEATQVPLSWIKMFSYTRVEHPSAPRVEKLYEYLSGKELQV